MIFRLVHVFQMEEKEQLTAEVNELGVGKKHALEQLKKELELEGKSGIHEDESGYMLSFSRGPWTTCIIFRSDYMLMHLKSYSRKLLGGRQRNTRYHFTRLIRVFL
jgi:hypothetical protein